MQALLKEPASKTEILMRRNAEISLFSSEKVLDSIILAEYIKQQGSKLYKSQVDLLMQSIEEIDPVL